MASTFGWLAQPGVLPWVVLPFGLCVGSFLNVVIHRLPKMLERGWREECAELAGQPLSAQALKAARSGKLVSSSEARQETRRGSCCEAARRLGKVSRMVVSPGVPPWPSTRGSADLPGAQVRLHASFTTET